MFWLEIVVKIVDLLDEELADDELTVVVTIAALN